MTSGARWRETMQRMETHGVRTFIEIGPGKVLSGLAKRSIQGISLRQVASSNDLAH